MTKEKNREQSHRCLSFDANALELNKEMHKAMWDDCGFNEPKNMIQSKNYIIENEWMQMLESWYVIVATFGTTVVLLTKFMSCTYVLTTVRANLSSQKRTAVMGFVNNSHFVSIHSNQTLLYLLPHNLHIFRGCSILTQATGLDSTKTELTSRWLWWKLMITIKY